MLPRVRTSRPAAVSQGETPPRPCSDSFEVLKVFVRKLRALALVDQAWSVRAMILLEVTADTPSHRYTSWRSSLLRVARATDTSRGRSSDAVIEGLPRDDHTVPLVRMRRGRATQEKANHERSEQYQHESEPERQGEALHGRSLPSGTLAVTLRPRRRRGKPAMVGVSMSAAGGRIAPPRAPIGSPDPRPHLRRRFPT